MQPVPQEFNGLNLGTAVAAGPTGATEVPGLYAAGIVSPMVQVLPAAASGQAAAAALAAELMAEDVAAAVEQASATGHDAAGHEAGVGAGRP